jgi:hypothetical protein
MNRNVFKARLIIASSLEPYNGVTTKGILLPQLETCESIFMITRVRHWTVSWFDSRCGHYIFFSINLIILAAIWLWGWVDSAFKRNEYQESFWDVKGDRRIRLTISGPSVSRMCRKCGILDIHGLYGLLQFCSLLNICIIIFKRIDHIPAF